MTLSGSGIVVMQSENMQPTSKYNDLVLIDLDGIDLSIGRSVVFILPDVSELQDIQRVTAMAGDRVSIVYGRIYVNGEVSPELDVLDQYRQRSRSLSMEEKTVPAGHVFVLGDNRDSSNDGRSWGFLPVDHIFGQPTQVFLSTELDKIGNSF